MPRVEYRRGVQTALHGAGLPYGFTVVVWCSGAALMETHRNPAKLEIVLFAAGAILAYSLLRLIAHGAHGRAQMQIASSGHVLRTGIIHALSIATAIGAAVLCSLIPGWVAWPLGSFAATLLYFALVGIELGREHVECDREEGKG